MALLVYLTLFNEKIMPHNSEYAVLLREQANKSLAIGFTIGMMLASFLMAIAWSFDIANGRREAIKRNAAEWVTDINGNSVYTWKPIPEQKPIPEHVEHVENLD